MENQIVDQDSYTESRRPTMLTVLCIITFAVSAYYLFEGTLTIFMSKTFDSSQWQVVIDQMNEALDGADPQSAKFLESIMDSVSITIERSINNSTLLGLIAILVALVSAYGAYLMFNLKRIGFTIYTGAKIAGIILPLIILGFNIVTILVYLFAAIVGLIFVILYGVNRKHMNA